MKTIRKLIPEKKLPLIFGVFYTVGLLLYFLPDTRLLFLWLTPLTLPGALAVVLIHHRAWNIKTIIIFTGVFILSFLTEMAGVATGNIFGAYEYLTTLGIKINDTPLIIGINWLLLIYGTNSLAGKLCNNRVCIILAGSTFMVLYDVVLEIAAPHLNMWQFENTFPPPENYLSWFGLSMVFHALFVIFRVETTNRAGRVMVIAQFLFFGILSGYFLFAGK